MRLCLQHRGHARRCRLQTACPRCPRPLCLIVPVPLAGIQAVMPRPQQDPRSDPARDSARAGYSTATAKVTVVRQETYLTPVLAPHPAQQVAERVAAELANAGAQPVQPDPAPAAAEARAQEQPTRGAMFSALVGGSEAETVEPSPDVNDRPADASAADSARPQSPSFAMGAPDQRPRGLADTAAVVSSATPSRSEATPASASSAAGVVKVVTIQLQPADLGTVTVRMSMKNDELDLQLQVERHETARLLQNDREKLAEVLRVAGYRIDDVGIVMKVVAQDAAGSTIQSAHAPANSPGQTPGSPHSDSGSSSGGRAQGDQQRNGYSHGDKPHDENSQSRAGVGRGLYL